MEKTANRFRDRKRRGREVGEQPRQPGKRTSPLLIIIVVVLAMIVVGGLGAAMWQNINKTGSSAGDALAEGTRKGPASAKAQVLIFSDFQ